MQNLHDRIYVYIHYANLHKINSRLLSSRLTDAFGEYVSNRKLIDVLKDNNYYKAFEYRYDDPEYKQYSRRYKLTWWISDSGVGEHMRLNTLKQAIKPEHTAFALWLACNNRPLMSYADIALFWPEYTKVELVEMVNLYFETYKARAKNLNKTQRTISLVQAGELKELQYCNTIRDIGYLYDEIVLKTYKITPRHYFNECNNHAKPLELTQL